PIYTPFVFIAYTCIKVTENGTGVQKDRLPFCVFRFSHLRKRPIMSSVVFMLFKKDKSSLVRDDVVSCNKELLLTLYFISSALIICPVFTDLFCFTLRSSNPFL